MNSANQVNQRKKATHDFWCCYCQGMFPGAGSAHTASSCDCGFLRVANDSTIAVLLLDAQNLGICTESGPDQRAFAVGTFHNRPNSQFSVVPSTGDQAAPHLMLPKKDQNYPSHPASSATCVALRNESFDSSDDKPLDQHPLFSWLVSRDFLLYFPTLWCMLHRHNHHIVIPILRNDNIGGSRVGVGVGVCFFDVIVWILEVAIAWSIPGQQPTSTPAAADAVGFTPHLRGPR